MSNFGFRRFRCGAENLQGVEEGQLPPMRGAREDRLVRRFGGSR